MQVESTSKPTFTMDEANEDTISAFEETDAAVDLRIKNSVCLVIDLGYVHTKAWFRRRILHAPNQILILVDSNEYVRLI